MNVCIVGAGYVGLTTGTCLAYLGHQVTCVDSDLRKISGLQAGKIPIYEPHLEELLQECGGRIRFTTEYRPAVSDADVVFIAVGTPPGPSGAPDLTFLAAAAREIGVSLAGGFTVVVNKSTVPIGSGNWVDSLVEDAYEAQHAAGSDRQFSVASNPEFLREGTAIHDTLYPDRVVIGTADERSAGILEKLYRPVLRQTFTPPSFLPRPAGFVGVPLVSTDWASAELIKYAANAFLALKISYINEIGALADRVGADITQVSKGIGLDKRIGPGFLQAGIGWGGSCFGKDTAALVSTAAEYSLAMPIVSAACEVNAQQRSVVIGKLLSELKILKGRTIGMFGLAFKPNTDDLRQAPAIEIARKLIERGCKVKAHDPVAMERFSQEHGGMGVICCAKAEEVAAGADAVILVTEWPEYRELDWRKIVQSMRTPIVLDGRHALDRDLLEACGGRYVALSRGGVQPTGVAPTFN